MTTPIEFEMRNYTIVLCRGQTRGPAFLRIPRKLLQNNNTYFGTPLANQNPEVIA
jgi:hypothetical protein